MPKRATKPSPVGYAGAPVKMEKVEIKNCPPSEFREKVLKLPLLAYDVETLSDGRKILVTKPGGKSVHNIMVWVYEKDPGKVHWRPTHEQIYEDLKEKIAHNREEGLAILDALEKVCEGKDPEDILAENPDLGKGLPGLPVDLILKAYKWIWAQEDCNYPPPRFEGREMSMKKLRKLKLSTLRR